MRIRRIIVAGTTVVALAATSASVAGPALAAPGGSGPVAAAQTYDARTVFRGLLFGHGPVADRLSAYLGQVPAATAETLAAEDAVIDKVEQTYPGTVNALADAVDSGSHVRTMKALTTARDNLAKATGTPAAVKDVEAALVVAAVAVVAAVVVVAVVKVKVKTSTAPSTQAQLTDEQFVHAIVTEFAR
jgi:SdpC family antimicrobial peptide